MLVGALNFFKKCNFNLLLHELQVLKKTQSYEKLSSILQTFSHYEDFFFGCLYFAEMQTAPLPSSTSKFTVVWTSLNPVFSNNLCISNEKSLKKSSVSVV